MSNRLANASSPYLRMHAGNPVHWQPWDDIALASARDQDIPVLLSIGYSACHWCHVMAHECFEKPEIAAAMNAAFVNIKLDREERPDIDRVYQLAHQALNGRGGGWPLTVFLDPQTLSPFYIGTYFPSTPRHGLPGFPEVLQRVRGYFDHHRNEVRANGETLQNWMRNAEAGGDTAVANADAIGATALQQLTAHFDPDWGGHRGAPKFPRAIELEWLLDQPGHSEAHGMARLTLATMATRGLQDHLGGGFFRYCVDASWTIPHFEKMLYDNAQLLPVYARIAADEVTEPRLREIATTAARGIVDWLEREMTAPGGAFYSALGADSEGEEGRFYLWTREQFDNALSESVRALAVQALGLGDPANFEGWAWHLLRVTSLDDVARQLGYTADPRPGTRQDPNAARSLRNPVAQGERGTTSAETKYAAARRALFDARERRVHPDRDDKILTAWNALTIAGLARSARLLDDARCADMARRALDALRESVWINGELYANVAEPASRIPGFLDDHAFLLDALLEAMQLGFDPRDLDWAIALADALGAKFIDQASGGFWFSTPEHATPLVRSRSWTDDALPNGNGAAIRALLRLGHLVGDTGYLDTAERALQAATGALQQAPAACLGVLRGLQEFNHPRRQLVVRCRAEQQAAWRGALHAGVREPGLAPGGDAIDAFIIPEQADALPGLLATRDVRGGDGTAYVCAGLTCQAPVMAPQELRAALRGAD